MVNKASNRGPLRKFGSQCWAVTNWGILRDVFYTKADAEKYARDQRPGEDWKQRYEIRKVTVTEGWRKRARVLK